MLRHWIHIFKWSRFFPIWGFGKHYPFCTLLWFVPYLLSEDNIYLQKAWLHLMFYLCRWWGLYISQNVKCSFSRAVGLSTFDASKSTPSYPYLVLWFIQINGSQYKLNRFYKFQPWINGCSSSGKCHWFVCWFSRHAGTFQLKKWFSFYLVLLR